jgi:hypothetical protein
MLFPVRNKYVYLVADKDLPVYWLIVGEQNCWFISINLTDLFQEII